MSHRPAPELARPVRHGHLRRRPNAGRVSDCGSFPAQNCVPIQWPGERETVYHELFPDPNIQGWFGSLVDDMRDATGQMYRRNRYYDPQTGQFTQPDPIGLAGGLNAYGFAEGDPVSYSDPYGLKIYCDNRSTVNGRTGCDLFEELRTAVNTNLHSDDPRVRTGARRLARMLNQMNNDENRHYLVVVGVLDDETGGGVEEAMPGRPGWRVATIDPSQSPYDPHQSVSASPWILLAHELGGARSMSMGESHDRGSVRAENGARMIVGCRKRGWHNSIFNPGCYR